MILKNLRHRMILEEITQSDEIGLKQPVYRVAKIEGSGIIRALLLTLLGFMIAFFMVMHMNSATAENNPQVITFSSLSTINKTPVTVAGTYLATRHAQSQEKWRDASSLLTNLPVDALSQGLLDKTFILSLGSGQYDHALRLSDNKDIDEALQVLAKTLKAISHYKNGDYQAAAKHMDRIPDKAIAIYIKPLALSWIYAGKNQGLQTSIEQLNTLPIDANTGDNPLFDINAGLLHEAYGQTDKASDFYKNAAKQFMTTRAALHIGDYFEHSDDADISASIYAILAQSKPFYKNIDRQNNARLTPKDGFAKTLFDFASFLYDQNAIENALLYTRLSHYLNPTHPETLMMLGDIMKIYKDYDSAFDLYKQIDGNASGYDLAQIRISEVLELQNKQKAALSYLNPIVERYPNDIDIAFRQGDLYHVTGQYEEAIHAYDRTESLLNSQGYHDWNLLYARATSYDALNNWPKSEQNLVTALELDPNNPMILNYLGYSWADRGVYLETAHDYISRASLLQPNNGYILDSLGWVLYKQGKFDKAADILERAVSLAPQDIEINMHLGDAYWQAGRIVEARYQWEKSKYLTNNETFLETLAQKIKSGVNTDQEAASLSQTISVMQ